MVAMVGAEIVDPDHGRVADGIENAVEQSPAPRRGSDAGMFYHGNCLHCIDCRPPDHCDGATLRVMC